MEWRNEQHKAMVHILFYFLTTFSVDDDTNFVVVTHINNNHINIESS